jgi:threonine dehydrogenase-like Zn-dependent dehydrogenase
MIGLWIQDGQLTLRSDLPVPEPQPGEVRLQVTCAGICSTDLELVKGYAGFAGVPGHEFTAIVEEGQGDWSGRRVVGEINASCGTCPTCQAGRRSHCPRRTVLGIVNRQGIFAQQVCLPTKNLHPIPPDVPDEIAVFTEPLAAALEIQEQLSITADMSVLVVGAGRLGQLIARSLALTGCKLQVTGRNHHKLQLLSALGIATLQEKVTARGFDLVVECTGNQAGFHLARQAVRPRGTLVLKSTYAAELSLDMSSLVVDEITLVGSRCGPFAPALDLLAAGKIPVEDLVTARFPLARGQDAFHAAAQRENMKVLLTPMA